MSRRTGPTAATVDVVWERDRGACSRCGKPLDRSQRGTQYSIHHRSPRGMGGRREEWVNQPANLLLLCGSGVTGCHGWVETNRSEAMDTGWIVGRNWRVTATEVAVLHAIHGMVHLTDDGGYTKEPPA